MTALSLVVLPVGDAAAAGATADVRVTVTSTTAGWVVASNQRVAFDFSLQTVTVALAKDVDASAACVDELLIEVAAVTTGVTLQWAAGLPVWGFSGGVVPRLAVTDGTAASVAIALLPSIRLVGGGACNANGNPNRLLALHASSAASTSTVAFATVDTNGVPLLSATGARLLEAPTGQEQAAGARRVEQSDALVLPQAQIDCQRPVALIDTLAAAGTLQAATSFVVAQTSVGVAFVPPCLGCNVHLSGVSVVLSRACSESVTVVAQLGVLSVGISGSAVFTPLDYLLTTSLTVGAGPTHFSLPLGDAPAFAVNNTVALLAVKLVTSTCVNVHLSLSAGSAALRYYQAAAVGDAGDVWLQTQETPAVAAYGWSACTDAATCTCSTGIFGDATLSGNSADGGSKVSAGLVGGVVAGVVAAVALATLGSVLWSRRRQAARRGGGGSGSAAAAAAQPSQAVMPA